MLSDDESYHCAECGVDLTLGRHGSPVPVFPVVQLDGVHGLRCLRCHSALQHHHYLDQVTFDRLMVIFHEHTAYWSMPIDFEPIHHFLVAAYGSDIIPFILKLPHFGTHHMDILNYVVSKEDRPERLPEEQWGNVRAAMLQWKKWGAERGYI